MTTTTPENALTPMMRQYTAIKAKYPDHIVFFRMGDFYEMFGEDAVAGSEILGITLTKRPHGRGGEIPLAGVPHHAAERYLAKLAESGRRVVVCEQTEDPKLAKGVVKRDVVEIITPGTVMLEGALEDTLSPRIAAVMGPDTNGQFGVAIAELTTGFFGVETCGPEALIELLSNNAPREVVIPQDAEDTLAQTVEQSHNTSRWPGWRFAADEAGRQLKSHFDVSELSGVGFGNSSGQISDVSVGSAGALLCYLKEMKCAPLTHITHVQHVVERTSVPLDESTAANLDVIARPGVDAPSLYSVLDRCRTSMGRRQLRRWLLNPLISKDLIDHRLDCVDHLVNERVTLRELGEQLKGIFDAERFIGRLGAQRINPRDVVALRSALARWPEIVELCSNSPLINSTCDPTSTDTEPTREMLDDALLDDPPNSSIEGGIFRRGYNAELDSLYEGAADARAWIAGLQATLREQTSIPSVKVGYNKVFNYYIEIPRTHSAKVPEDWIRKQTLVANERFVTPELKEKEEIVLRADERAAALEERLFTNLRDDLTATIEVLTKLAQSLARLDVLCALANGALLHGYVRPVISDSRTLEIQAGRHPVLETINPAGQFVPNETSLDDASGWMHILTGPNMAGKSTYLRQVGLIVLMAQVGSFVPADKATIGLVDRIFTRVGADDDLTRNRSTFMVEMAETARILTGTTERSLILFDEVGRGTSTYDGVAIAWSIAEHLGNEPSRCPRTLFATHYHELTALADRFEAIRNYQLAVREKNGAVAFIYRVKPGACDDSFGIHVARMAGVPVGVIDRANEILSALEGGTFDPLKKGVGLRARRHAVAAKQVNLFSDQQRAAVTELAELKPECMTPIEALNKLDELTRRMRPNG